MVIRNYDYSMEYTLNIIFIEPHIVSPQKAWT